MASDVQVIVKRVKKGGHDAPHGGAWKVAYADFVTAMMAFFLLLWLLNATTEVQKQGISDYFSPSTVSRSTGGAGGMLGGRAVSSPGAMTSRTAVPSVSLNLEPTTGASEGRDEEDTGASGQDKSAPQTAEQKAQAQRQREEAQFDRVDQVIREVIRQSPDLRGLEKNILVDHTPEGLRIQIIDREGHPMFALGSARMFDRTRQLVEKIAAVIQALPNKIKITGHTDSLPFRGGSRRYGNWELSSDRAQASRRVLVAAGLDPNRIVSVAGRAAGDPLLPDKPESPRNRRVSIVLLRQAVEKAEAAAKPPPPAAAVEPTKLKRDWNGPRVR